MSATATGPQFTASRFEIELMRKIVKRAQILAPNMDYQTMDAMMDLEACHCSGNPLDLSALLEADDFNLMHDVYGIRSHLDRSSGDLTGCFYPRYSLPLP